MDSSVGIGIRDTHASINCVLLHSSHKFVLHIYHVCVYLMTGPAGGVCSEDVVGGLTSLMVVACFALSCLGFFLNWVLVPFETCLVFILSDDPLHIITVIPHWYRIVVLRGVEFTVCDT